MPDEVPDSLVGSADAQEAMKATRGWMDNDGDFKLNYVMTHVCNGKKGFDRTGELWRTYIFPAERGGNADVIRKYWPCTRCRFYNEATDDAKIAVLRAAVRAAWTRAAALCVACACAAAYASGWALAGT